jgi:hypothetical protein
VARDHAASKGWQWNNKSDKLTHLTGKKMDHAAGSLPQLVENLVKNWEVEASFKPRLEDWRTIDHANYTFAINGGPPQTAEHMLKVGTYNAIITPNEFYSPENSDFASSHKTFKRMMPTFAWEVLEVYSGPPTVAFKWRHWGTMKNDYVGFNEWVEKAACYSTWPILTSRSKGRKITAKAHGGIIDIQGVTVATVDEVVRLQAVDTWFDPLEMFRQIAPGGIVNKEIMNRKVDLSDALETVVPQNDGVKIAEEHNDPSSEHAIDPAPEDIVPKQISNGTSEPADAFVPHQGADTEKSAEKPDSEPTDAAQEIVASAAENGADAELSKPPSNFDPETSTSNINDSTKETEQNGERLDESRATGTYDAVDAHLESSAEKVHPHPSDMEKTVKPAAGEAVVAPADSTETRMTHEEMSSLSNAGECPFLMNRE